MSDGVHAGEREDRSGAVLEELLRAEGFEVARRVVADEHGEISEAVTELAIRCVARSDNRRHRLRAS